MSNLAKTREHQPRTKRESKLLKKSMFGVAAALMLAGVLVAKDKDTAGAAPETSACAEAMSRAEISGNDTYLRRVENEGVWYGVSVQGDEDIAGICNTTALELAGLCNNNAPYLNESGIYDTATHGVLAAQALDQNNAQYLTRLASAACAMELYGSRTAAELNDNPYSNVPRTYRVIGLEYPNVLHAISFGNFVTGKGFWGPDTDVYGTITAAPEIHHSLPTSA